jgi:hypothetical protein
MLSQQIKERNKLTEQINKAHDKLTKRIEREFKGFDVHVEHNEVCVLVYLFSDLGERCILNADKDGSWFDLINEDKAKKVSDMWYDVYYSENV